MNQYICLKLKVPENLQYPNFGVGDKILGAKIVGVTGYDIFQCADVAEEALRVIDLNENLVSAGALDMIQEIISPKQLWEEYEKIQSSNESVS